MFVLAPQPTSARPLPSALTSQSMTTSTPPGPAASEEDARAPFYTALRAFGLVVLALMLVAITYAGWIAIENWGSIRV